MNAVCQSPPISETLRSGAAAQYKCLAVLQDVLDAWLGMTIKERKKHRADWRSWIESE